MRAAYADPPYVGQARKHYRCEEVDHADLIARLNTYDAWALSLSSPSLKNLLNLCPDDVRVAAWVKPFAVFKPNVNPAYTWEPVIFRGARRRTRQEPTIKDHLIESITLKKGLVGAKPPRFCDWVFDLLGLNRERDTLDDLFPGTGIVTRQWEAKP